MEQTENKKRRVYSTQAINQILADRDQGYEIDFEPFYNKDVELRAANIPFMMTDDEIKEYQKCYDNPEYFIDTYCKFMTDHGLSTVNLRDYQRKVINIVTEETWSEKLQDWIPKNRSLVWLAARQCGKCLIINELAKKINSSGSEENISFLDMYYENNHKNIFDFFKIWLYKRYEKDRSTVFKKIKKLVFGKIIETVERIELRHVSLDESDENKKIVDFHDINEMLLTDSGPHKANRIYRTQPYTVYNIKFKDGTFFECADKHILYKLNDNKNVEIFACDLKDGDRVVASNECGFKEVENVLIMPYKLCMYDLSIDSNEHRYYTSDILSHNTTTIASFLAWMLVFHIDRNILIVANKEKTAIEIVDKLINVFRGLPFYLKPGCDTWGKSALKLDNGSRIITGSSSSSSSIGYTIHCVLLDEFSHVQESVATSFWRSVYPTITSSEISQCIITSTPNGTTNKFYEIWDGAINGRNSFIPVRTDWWECHDPSFKERMLNDFGPEEWAQEFELQFNKGSKMIMKTEDMQFLEPLCVDYVHKHINVTNTYLDTDDLLWHPDFDPNSINYNDRYVFLVDLAEGNGDPDEGFKSDKKKTPDANTINIFKLRLTSPANLRKYSNISCGIKDCIRFVQVGRYCCNTEDEVHTAKVCAALAYNLFQDHLYNNVRVMVEMNFNGKSFFEEFKRHQCYAGSTILRTYHKKPIPGERLKKKYGFKTTTNKEYYCLKGNKMISQRRIIPTCKLTYNQMIGFGFVRGKLTGIGMHDDLSITVFNHIPRMLDESSFVGWIEEWMVFYADKNIVYKLNDILQKWAIDNPEMSDGDFNELYGIGQSSPMIGNNNNGNVDFGNGPSGAMYGGYDIGGYNGYGGFGSGGFGGFGGGGYGNPYGL